MKNILVNLDPVSLLGIDLETHYLVDSMFSPTSFAELLGSLITFFKHDLDNGEDVTEPIIETILMIMGYRAEELEASVYMNLVNRKIELATHIVTCLKRNIAYIPAGNLYFKDAFYDPEKFTLHLLFGRCH